jgi:serine/threonine-protein kinase HipA
MRRRIDVLIGDTPRLVGALHHEARGQRESSAFEYDAAWLAANDRYPIEPGLPLVAGPQYPAKIDGGRVFHGAIADSEPDGWARAVIKRDHAKQRNEARSRGEALDTRPLDNLDFLLAVDDVSRVGALRFRDEDGVYRRAGERGRRTTPPLIELQQLLAATRAVETNSETAADLAYLRGRGTSLGGLRPKCSVVDEEGNLSIAKFPSVQDDRAVTKGEVLALRLARKAGISAAQAELVVSDSIPVALIRRFDRARGAGRLHYISAATLLGAGSGAGEHAYTDIVDAIRMHGAAAYDDIEELWRRVAFFILITNVDDHLWNHGFLHASNGLWRISPAFDVNPFPERDRQLKTWISEETGPDATIDALMSIIGYCGIKAQRARSILGQVEAAVSTWRAEGRAVGLTASEIDQYADAFEHAERDAARRVVS